MSELQIELFNCRSDNFGVLIHDAQSGKTVSIDAPEEAPILAALDRRGWTLSDIFTTHHHPDHVEANLALKARFDVEITGPKNEADKIPGIGFAFGDGGSFAWAGHPVRVIETPGHTAGHICYYLPEDRILFSADTLFALGCGRLFERPPRDMWQSLSKLKALPGDTVVYFGHEYTLANARFALTIDPHNQALVSRVRDIERQRAEGVFTAPTTIERELQTNPFLRADDPAIRKHLGMEGAEDWEVFAEIRARKDRF
ncbi:hydroxyacylglutathione hydrolase [Rhizobium sp. KVB221]|uniref:Hydroxyacylglutathione hydrolase n=1 Tax=Rhizobium setariae TaxID=2801340 RepID=A0A936YW25_9HYPH|nr:hydroxyacylglutathione hydrolase [Rhizobium setariae]MBL0374697.1 hydroxyacylglutathione hydrolase [Rhizobium setariae]